MISRAAAYEFFVWALAAGMTLWAYMAVSLSESWDLVFAALDASAPTMWLVPAILLISLRTPAGSAFALLLIANAARMLAARRAPRLEAPPRGGPAGINRAAQPMFQCAGGQPIRNGTFLATAGAFGFQAGICAVCAERPLAAGGLFATGAILWTLAADNRTEPELRARPILRHLLLGVAATALLLAESRMEPLHGNASAARASGWLDEAQRVLKAAARSAPPPEPAPKRSATSVFVAGREIGRVGRDGFPGVVLQPEPPPRGNPRGILLARGTGVAAAPLPLTLPFTGEYYLFPSLYEVLPEGFVIYRGTPLDGIYATLSGGPLETQAYQKLDPPLDFANCGKVRLTISSGESSPASATMQLVLPAAVAELGTQIFALEPSSEETLEFATPAARVLTVRGIRIVFQCDPQHRDRNTKVAVKEFTLVPRGS